MAGLNHDFLVIPKSIISEKTLFNYQIIKNNQAKVTTLHDDYVRYFSDSFNWLNTDDSDVLPYYGNHILSLQQCLKLKAILQAWHDLFLCAPENFTLTGSWMTIVGEDDSGRYEKISVQREELLQKLKNIIDMCNQVKKDESLVLLYWGI